MAQLLSIFVLLGIAFCFGILPKNVSSLFFPESKTYEVLIEMKNDMKDIKEFLEKTERK